MVKLNCLQNVKENTNTEVGLEKLEESLQESNIIINRLIQFQQTSLQKLPNHYQKHATLMTTMMMMEVVEVGVTMATENLKVPRKHS